MHISQRILSRERWLIAMLLTPLFVLFSQVPTFRQATGHDIGEKITLHHQMVAYLQKLAATSDRVAIAEQGASWEGRTFMLAVVTSPRNHARLKEIQANAQRLADPRVTTPEEAKSIITTQPTIVWYGGSIHGFELSGSEGLLKLLEHLTTRSDSLTLRVLDQTVILIDPILNPDGRDAFAHINIENLGAVANPEPDDWSNNFTSWEALKFRTGHYYFDSNRDWFAHTQRETRERVKTLQAWRPQVGVDAHEMGSDLEFYFDPPVDFYSPYFPDYARRWLRKFGDAYAKAFDQAGFEYFSRELFNYFYPGYTTAYLSYQGAVGMLYEQGSSRGLALKRPDGSVRTLFDALQQQYVAAWTAAQLAARERETLLWEYYAAHQQAIDDGKKGTRRYVIDPEGDLNLVAELVNLLMRNGIEVHTITKELTLNNVKDRFGKSIGSKTFPAGSYLVEAAQPRNRLLRTLLETDLPLPAGFLRQARERVDRGESARFYDITGFSLPLLFNLGCYSSTDGRQGSMIALAEPIRQTVQLPPAKAEYAYLIDGKQAASLAALYHLKQNKYRAAVLWKPTQIEGKKYSSGTVVIRVGQNDASIHDAIRNLAQRFRLDVDAVKTGHAGDAGPSLGSADASFMVKKPVIALVAEDPFQAYSFGWTWYTLDRQYEIPVTVLRARMLERTKLDRFNVLVFPEVADTTALVRLLGPAGTEKISRWVREGGTLVTIGSSTDFARKQLKLTKLRSWYEVKEKGKSGGKEGETETTKAQHFSVPGAIFRVTIDNERWLSAGYEKELPVLVNSDRLYLAPDEPPSSSLRTVAKYGERGDAMISGHAWPETLERIAGTVFAYEERVGQGRVISFAEDVNFRAYWRGANRFFLNAVILGPSAP